MKRRDFLRASGFLVAGTVAGAVGSKAADAKSNSDQADLYALIDSTLVAEGIKKTEAVALMAKTEKEVLPFLSAIQQRAPELNFDYQVRPMHEGDDYIQIETNIPSIDPFGENSMFDTVNPLSILVEENGKDDLYILADNNLSQARGMKEVIPFIIQEAKKANIEQAPRPDLKKRNGKTFKLIL